MLKYYDVIDAVVSVFAVSTRSQQRAMESLTRLTKAYALTIEEFTALQTYECAFALSMLLECGWLCCDGRRKLRELEVRVPVFEGEFVEFWGKRAYSIYERFEERDADQFSRSMLTLLSSALQGYGSVRPAWHGEPLLPRLVEFH